MRAVEGGTDRPRQPIVIPITVTYVSGYTHSAFSPPGWIYGFNYGSKLEGTNAPWHHLAAHVLMMGAFRRDMGIE